LGTGSVKVAVVTSEGTVHAKAARGYPLSSPSPGWAEADPHEWLAATKEAVSELGDTVAVASAVGFSGQMHGLVLCDERFEPVRPAITWADTRAGAEAVNMHRELGTEVLARLGSPAVSGFAATSLRWIADHEPASLEAASHALQPKDWLRARLGGDVVTEPSDASGTLLADVARGAWDERAVSWTDVDPCLLAPIVDSRARVGAIALGGRELECVAGAADTAAAIVGFGLSVGDGFTAVGSGSQSVSVVAEPDGGIALGTHLFATAGAPGSGWYRIGAVQNAGIALRRALEWLEATPDQANAALADGVRASDPIFVPYVAGERTPFVDSSLRGAWLGLGLDTDRQAMLRSVIEGVAHAVALGMQAVVDAGAHLPEPLPLIGGGTVDERFRQLIADIAQRPLLPMEEPDAAVIGAAFLAMPGEVTGSMAASGAAVVAPNAGRAELLHERRARLVDYVASRVSNTQ
jgi:xylulokinase